MSETKVREDICRLGRSLFDRGLTPGSSGNISVNLEDGGWLVTPTNASLGSLDPARLSRLDSQGRLASGDPPTKEVPLHTALYQTRQTARAVVHLHSTHSVALSMLPEIDPRAALPPMTAYYLMKCGSTALVPYYRPGDPAVAGAITSARVPPTWPAGPARSSPDTRGGRCRCSCRPSCPSCPWRERPAYRSHSPR